MNGDDKRQPAALGDGQGDATETAQCVRVNKRSVAFSPQISNQTKGEEVSAHGNHVRFSLSGNPPHWNVSFKSFDGITVPRNRVGSGAVLSARTVQHGPDLMMAQTIEQVADGRFRATPLG